jgi:hypothetical protein
MTDHAKITAAHATRRAFASGLPLDHAAAIAAHEFCRGGEFEPQPTSGSFQPRIDSWRFHDGQIKMHEKELVL